MLCCFSDQKERQELVPVPQAGLHRELRYGGRFAADIVKVVKYVISKVDMLASDRRMTIICGMRPAHLELNSKESPTCKYDNMII